MDSIQGRALVASPYLNDPNFLRSVVYMIRHDEQGGAGLMLNRPTNTHVGYLLEQLSGQKVDNDQPVFWGGPVDGPVTLLQELRRDAETGIAATNDQEKILEMCSRVKATNVDDGPTGLVRGRFHLFEGYAGWAPDQLDCELRSGDWLVWDIQPDDLFSDTDCIWERAVKAIGRDILSQGIDPSRLPDNPAFN